MHDYTDFLGNPIQQGDLVAYPTAAGSSSAEMNIGRVLEVLPIIPNDVHDQKCRYGVLAADRGKSGASSRTICGKWVKRPDLQNGYGDYLRDDSKAYMLSVEKLPAPTENLNVFRPGVKTRIKNVDRVIVVTEVYDGAE